MKLVGLEILRALAALLVFMNHLSKNVEGFQKILLLQMAMNFTTEAVIVLFVLSGATITLSQQQ